MLPILSGTVITCIGCAASVGLYPVRYTAAQLDKQREEGNYFNNAVSHLKIFLNSPDDEPIRFAITKVKERLKLIKSLVIEILLGKDPIVGMHANYT